MQVPHTWHWQDQDREVRDYIEDSGSFVDGEGVIAVTRGNQFIPGLLNRTALKYIEEHGHNVEYEDAYHRNSDCKEQG